MRTGFSSLAASIPRLYICRSACSILLPFLEIAGTNRPGLREAAGFVLHLTLATGAITVVLGILLAYGSGVMGSTVTRHMWGGIALLIELLVCVTVRPAWISGQTNGFIPLC